MSDPLELPRRRITIEISLGADSYEDAVRYLAHLVKRIHEKDMDGSTILGGYSCNYACEIVESPEVTHESYINEVEKFKHDMTFLDRWAINTSYELHRSIGCNIELFRKKTREDLYRVIKDAVERINKMP